MKILTLRLFTLLAGVLLLISCKNEDKTPETQAAPAAATTTEQGVEANNSEIKVNPAHGLPGHRCDIPVGAPLTAATGSTANPTGSPVELPSSSVSPVRIDQTPDVNPPHGEPGHDCAVPVGAPLKK